MMANLQGQVLHVFGWQQGLLAQPLLWHLAHARRRERASLPEAPAYMQTCWELARSHERRDQLLQVVVGLGVRQT
jgi:hypothetical protein